MVVPTATAPTSTWRNAPDTVVRLATPPELTSAIPTLKPLATAPEATRSSPPTTETP
jgi:hypothetical protein